MKKYFPKLILLLVISCAHTEKEAPSKNYSDDTNRAFDMIERGGSYYLKKAPESSTPPEVIVIDDKINHQSKPSSRKTKSNSMADERLIEINQNLAFYCMKHRNNPAYGGVESKCLEHVNATMKNCQRQHRSVNSKLLKCIQMKLKK